MKRRGYFASILGAPNAAVSVLRPPRRLFAPEFAALEPAPHMPVSQDVGAPPKADVLRAKPGPARAELESPRAGPTIDAPRPPELPAAAAVVPELHASLTPRLAPRPLTETTRFEEHAASNPDRKTAPGLSAGHSGSAEKARGSADIVPLASEAGVERDGSSRKDHRPAPLALPVPVARTERSVANPAARTSRPPLPRAPSLHIGSIEVTVVPVPSAPSVARAVETARSRPVARPFQRPGVAPWYGLGQR